jgi:hypothetical protein
VNYLKRAGVFLTIAAVVAASSGCQTMRTVTPLTGPTATHAFSRIEIGDLVSVEMRDGTRHRFEVSRIESDALVADDGRKYPRGEIVGLEHENVDARRTTGLVLGITVGFYIFVKIAEATNFFGLE